MKNIIVPFDFSEEAKHALKTAIQFASKTRGKVKLLHVVEVPSGYLSLYPEYSGFQVESVYSDDIIKVLQKKLDSITKEVGESGVEVTSQLLYGKPFKSIQETIVSEDADLIVMGSKGATGLKEMFVGSNAERVIRYSSVPVLTVKSPVDFSHISDLVFATDFSDNKSIELTKTLQRLFDLKIKLLKVYNSSDWAYTESSALDKLKEFALEHNFHDYSYHVYDAPFVTDGILQFSSKMNADLIVMGTHGFTGIGHLIAGSNAEDVANHTKIPLFTIKV